jgi:hypothetical protein
MTDTAHDVRAPRTEDSQMRSVTETLVHRFGADMTATEIGDEVETCRRRFVAAPIRTFVPLLVERAAVMRLRQVVADTALRANSQGDGH